MEEDEFDFPIIPASNGSLAKRKLLCGVGVNDARYITQPSVGDKSYKCPYYKRWKSMIERGYCPKVKEKSPTYKRVTVCKEWHTFSTFRSWMETQDWEGKQLDKDVIVPNNKVYSPETCVFVSKRVNSLLTDCSKSRGKYKQGVHMDKGKYRAQCRKGTGERKRIGLFPTEALAYEAYVNYKHNLILQVAAEQEDERVRDGLRLHAQILLDTLEEPLT